jgi:biopolymer transport protein ExbD
MARKRKEMKKTKVEIIPMIDTMFFLLVFFILSSVGVIKLQGIDINLPKADSAPAVPTQKQEKPDELIVAINEKGAVSVNTKVAPDGEITELLKSELRSQLQKKNISTPLEEVLKETTVVISADPKAMYAIMVDCMDQARALGIRQFAIAAQQ